MTRQPALLTDAAIRAAFAERAARADSGDLVAAILAETATMPQRRPWAIRLGQGIGIRYPGRVATVLLLLALLAMGAIIALSVIRGDARSSGLLAYVRDGTIFLAEPDGTHELVAVAGRGAELGHPAWSPDGRLLAFQAPSGVFVLDPGTLASRLVTRGDLVGWSPDGTSIAAANAGEVTIVDVATGIPTLHLPTRDTVEGLAWSPDGRWLAGWTSTVLLRIDATTGETQPVASNGGAQRGAAGAPAWSPDSRRLAYLTPNDTDCSGISGTVVTVAGADGSGARDISGTGRQAFDPAWSPDGAWIAFAQTTCQNSAFGGNTTAQAAERDLVVVHPDGSDPHVVTSKVQSFAWAADSRSLLVAVPTARAGAGELWRVPADGGMATSLGLNVGTDAIAVRALPPGQDSAPLQPNPAASATPEPGGMTAAAPRKAVLADPSGTLTGVAGQWTVSDSTGNDCTHMAVLTFAGSLEDRGPVCATSTVTHADGTVEIIGQEADWAPDGSAYAVTNGDRVEIHRPDGRAVATSIPLGGNPAQLSWAPDGTLLAVDACPADSGRGCTGSGWTLLRGDATVVAQISGAPTWAASGHEILQVSGLQDYRATGPLTFAQLAIPNAVVSPDSERIAYESGGNAWVAAADGSDPEQLTDFAFGGVLGVTWSPDGRWVAFDQGSRIWVMDPNGRGRHYFDTGATAVFGVTWSPDSAWVQAELYTLDQRSVIVLLPVSGTKVVLLDDAIDAHWSPYGRYLLIGRWANGAVAGWDVANGDGSGRTPIAGSATFTAPEGWIPK